MKLLIFYCNQDIPKAYGVNSNANPQRVALKETQDLKVRLQECLQLSGTNNYANRQHTQGHNIMANGPQKPTSATQLYPKKDLQGNIPGGKHEQCSGQRQNFMSAQRTDNHSSVEPKGENKENKESKEKGKSKDPR